MTSADAENMTESAAREKLLYVIMLRLWVELSSSLIKNVWML